MVEYHIFTIEVYIYKAAFLRKIMKIPKHAKCVFEGILYDTYQWEQEMFDGSTKTFEALRRKPSVQIIPITTDNKIVILKEKQPTDTEFGYSLVGGGCDEYDEDPKDAAKREMLEETGMVCEELELYETKRAGSKIDWPCYYFIARGCKKIQEQNVDQGGEIIEPLEVSFEEFIEKIEDTYFRNPFFRDMILLMEYKKPEEFKEFKRKLGVE